MKQAKPKCPDCKTVGLEKIVSEESAVKSRAGDAWFEVVSCFECGHVYGVFPKIVYGPTMKLPNLSNIPGM